MTTAPEPRHSAERAEDYREILIKAFEHRPSVDDAQALRELEDFVQRLDLAVGWTVACEMQDTFEFLNAPTEAERRAALHRQKVLVHVLLTVAVTTLLTSLYAMGVGHEATAWFGFAGALGLCWMAHRAEEGR